MNKSLELLINCKKNDISEEMIVNVWLDEFFNITLESLKSDSRFYKKNGKKKKNATDLFHQIYRVTNSQYNWWYNQIIDILSKKYRYSKKIMKKKFLLNELNTSPSINYDENN